MPLLAQHPGRVPCWRWAMLSGGHVQQPGHPPSPARAHPSPARPRFVLLSARYLAPIKHDRLAGAPVFYSTRPRRRLAGPSARRPLPCPPPGAHHGGQSPSRARRPVSPPSPVFTRCPSLRRCPAATATIGLPSAGSDRECVTVRLVYPPHAFFGVLALVCTGAGRLRCRPQTRHLDFHHPAAFAPTRPLTASRSPTRSCSGPSLNGPAVAGGRAGFFLSVSFAAPGDTLVSVSAPGTASAARITGDRSTCARRCRSTLTGPVTKVVLTGSGHPPRGRCDTVHAQPDSPRRARHVCPAVRAEVPTVTRTVLPAAPTP